MNQPCVRKGRENVGSELERMICEAEFPILIFSLLNCGKEGMRETTEENLFWEVVSLQ